MGKTILCKTLAPKVPSQNPLEYCRLCFSTDPSKKVQLQFDAVYWIEYIKRTVGIQMTIEVDLPFAICIGCKTTLESVDHFRQTCLVHDTALRQFREGKINYETGESTIKIPVTVEVPAPIPAGGEDESEDESDDTESNSAINVNRCLICKINCPTVPGYRRHMKNVHGKSRGIVTCPFCPCRFRKNTLFQRHVLDHSKNSKPIAGVMFTKKKCQYCKKKFKPGKEMGQHEGTEHGLMFECRLCYERFGTEKDKQCHKLMHLAGTGGPRRKAKCRICSRVFPNRHCYNIHVKKHKKSFMCWTCSSKFPIFELYVQHQIALHNGQLTVNECVECQEIFKDKEEFVQHLDLKHAVYDQDVSNDELSDLDEDFGVLRREEAQSSQPSQQLEPETVSLSSSDDFPIYMDENGDDDDGTVVVEEQSTTNDENEGITDRLEEELMLDEVPRDTGFDLYGTAFQPQNTISLIEELSD